MAQLGQFIVNHWQLWLALLFILLLIYMNELITRKKQAKSVSPQAAVHLINHEHAVIVDIRDAESYRKGHIIDSISATSEAITQGKLDKYKNKPLIIVCTRGMQSATLAKQLQQQGFEKPLILAGGITAWQNAELPLMKGK